MSKHTPGPWTWESGWYAPCPGDSCDIRKYNGDGSYEWVGTVNTQFTTIENGEANARLIAAAPEMYELLKTISIEEQATEPTINVINRLLTRINTPS